jgi:flagellar protein FliS
MRNDFAAKGVFISKAIAIIGEGLHASLDKKVGGELAENMSSLYEYMVKRLIDANLKNDITILDEVSGLLGELAGAWDSIRPNYIQPGSQLMGSANAQLAYRRA